MTITHWVNGEPAAGGGGRSDRLSIAAWPLR